MFLLHMDKRELEEAARFVNMTARAYGPKHPRLRELGRGYDPHRPVSGVGLRYRSYNALAFALSLKSGKGETAGLWLQPSDGRSVKH
jgi:hypothetical protein